MCPVQTSPRGARRASHMSGDPQSFVAYAPRGVGLLCALVYAARNDDVCGWWVGAADGGYQTAFFLLDRYFTRDERAFYATRGGDLYRGWAYDYRARPAELDKPVPVEDSLCHELEHIQFVFAQEWLSFAGDADAGQQNASYREAELAHQDVNVKFHRLNKLDKDDLVWTYRSAGLDLNVVKRLMRDWPLECRTVYGRE